MKNFFFSTVLLCFFCACSSSSQNALKPLHGYKLNISEPSGITSFENHLFIVSDYNGMVYKTDLKGKILDKIQLPTTDNEGVCFDGEGNLIVVNETKRKLLKIDNKGEVFRKLKIKGKQKNKNSGLEGVCFDKKEKVLYVINEKSPRKLLKLDEEGKIIDSFKLNFSNDVSGICFDNSSNSFWVVSDESHSIFNINRKGELIKNFNIPVSKAEGIVIHNSHLYIVSDLENKLYVFKIPN